MAYLPVKPQNTIIAFDLHGVLFLADYKSIAKHFWNGKNKIKLCIILLNPLIWIDVIKLRLKKSVAEQYIIGLAKKYNSLKPYVPLGIQIANSQRPIAQTIEIVKKLKEKGYSLALFSNIGAEIFQDLRQKFPDIFTHFDILSLPSEQNGYIRKPFKKAFINFISSCKKQKKQIIFVDDKKKNIATAQSNNILGIHFRSPHQLQRKLEDLGIL